MIFLPNAWSLPDVIDGQRDRPLHHRHGMVGDDHPLLRQFLHELDEALAFLEAEQVLGRQRDILEEQLRGVGGIEAELLELAAAAETRRVGGFHHHQRDALGALLRIGLGDDDDQVGVLAVGDEGLRAVEQVAVALLHRRGADVLQVGAGAGLAHGDGADHLAAGELGQPALLLLLGAEAQDVGRDDPGMQRRAEGVHAGEAVGAVDDRLMGECAARAAVFLGDHGAEQARLPGLGPDLAWKDLVFVPLVDMRREFGLSGTDRPDLREGQAPPSSRQDAAD